MAPVNSPNDRSDTDDTETAPAHDHTHDPDADPDPDEDDDAPGPARYRALAPETAYAPETPTFDAYCRTKGCYAAPVAAVTSVYRPPRPFCVDCAVVRLAHRPTAREHALSSLTTPRDIVFTTPTEADDGVTHTLTDPTAADDAWVAATNPTDETTGTSVVDLGQWR